MDLKNYTVGIAAGDGLIARRGDVVIYIADATASAGRLLAAVEALSDVEHPGTAVAERLATLTFGPDTGQAAPFGVIAPTAEGLLVILRGRARAEIEGADGVVRILSGDRALTWVDEILPATVRRVAVTGAAGSRVSEFPQTDLCAGVVPGGGFVLHSAGATENRPAPAESSAAETIRGQEPTQLAQSPGDTAPGGTALVETAALVSVPGVLQSGDGVEYPLDRDYVIGRDPVRDDAVNSAAASPIVLHHDQHISRVHAYISIDAARVLVRDAATPGGTFIAAPGTESWTRIGTTPTELEPGWRLRVGERILIYKT